MSIRIVQLGSPRAPDEGSRIGTVRRPPRGVPKAEFARRNYYDSWLPELSPEPELMQLAQSAVKLMQGGQSSQSSPSGQSAEGARQWRAFDKQFRRQMANAPAARILDALAALSHSGAFSLGCYCDEEALCHRSILRSLLAERGAHIEDGAPALALSSSNRAAPHPPQKSNKNGLKPIFH